MPDVVGQPAGAAAARRACVPPRRLARYRPRGSGGTSSKATVFMARERYCTAGDGQWTPIWKGLVALMRCTALHKSGVRRGQVGSAVPTPATKPTPRKASPRAGSSPAKRRGRDSNPRSALRRLTVFETAPFNHSGTPPRCGQERLAAPRLRRYRAAMPDEHVAVWFASTTRPIAPTSRRVQRCRLAHRPHVSEVVEGAGGLGEALTAVDNRAPDRPDCASADARGRCARAGRARTGGGLAAAAPRLRSRLGRVERRDDRGSSEKSGCPTRVDPRRLDRCRTYAAALGSWRDAVSPVWVHARRRVHGGARRGGSRPDGREHRARLGSRPAAKTVDLREEVVDADTTAADTDGVAIGWLGVHRVQNVARDP